MKIGGGRLRWPLVWSLVCVVVLGGSLLSSNWGVAALRYGDPVQKEVKVTGADNGRQVGLVAGQTLVVSLDAVPSTGYLWELDTSPWAVVQVGKPVLESQSQLLGAPATQTVRLLPAAAGETNVKLVYQRPWEKERAPAKSFSVKLRAEGDFASANRAILDAVPAEGKGAAEGATPQGGQAGEVGGTLGALPTHFDWREQGKTTSVKDQSWCGACWAFATVGVAEANVKINDGITMDFSEQYLVSCNEARLNDAGYKYDCGGGWFAHQYFRNAIPTGERGAGGVLEASFPYQASDGSCNPPHTHYETIQSWAYVNPSNRDSVASVDAIKQAIYNHGPVAVAIHIDWAFQSYSGGVFATNESGDVNHAVVLTGWDDAAQVWYLKNSWGTGWGESGYMRIRWGTSQVGYAANYEVYRYPYRVNLPLVAK